MIAATAGATWPKVLVLALVYMLLGRVALSLAVPPGYAMAIYPPAGVALAALLVGGCRLAPGVGLGSLLLNLWIGAQTGHGLTASACLLAVLIALGASMQAVCGSFLIRRWVGYPAALDTNGKILGFMLLGGPASCMISAGVGVASLRGLGLINLSSVVNNWLTWWVGDALGVLIVAPICLILFGQPASIWRSRRVNVLIPLLLTLAAVVVAFLFVRQWEQRAFQGEFRDRSQRIVDALQIRLDYHVEVQKSVVSLFAASNTVSRKQFIAFVAEPISNYPALQSIGWAPRVGAAERAAFEQSVRDEGYAGFTIREPGVGRQLVTAGPRKEYFPVDYFSPSIGNEQIIGLDLGAGAVRAQTLEGARDTGLPVASEPLKLLRGDGAKLATLLMAAVYAPNRNTSSQNEKRNALLGVVVSELRVGEVLDGMLSTVERADLRLRLADAAAPGLPFIDTLGAATDPASTRFMSSLAFAGRELVLTAIPTAAYINAHQSWTAWSALVGGLLFAGLLGMYLLLMSGRSFSVESLIAQRTSQLHDSEERLHAILDNAADGILTVDGNGEISMANRAAQSLLGYRDGELLHKTLDALFYDDEDHAILFKDYLHVEKNADGQLFKELSGRRPDGSALTVELAIAVLRHDEHAPFVPPDLVAAQFVVIIHDLTERKRADRLKGEFVSAVSHELRTPLTSICGSLGLLAGGVGGQLPEQSMKLIRLANDNAERLSGLINDILDFEKLEYGGMLFKLTPHNLLQLVRSVIDINDGFAQKFSIVLVLDPADCTLVQVLVDSNRLTQVLTNLLSNAIKFSHPQGRVAVSLSRSDNVARVTVRDDGVGIPCAFRPRIFAKFSQADGSQMRKHAGTGLGLSLSKSMIEKMGGSIGFDSVEGQGSTFYIELPLAGGIVTA
jgi:PAS domain S-box-containing protein